MLQKGSKIVSAPRRRAIAVSTVARHLMTASIGDRIPTIAEIAVESGTGTGTVQSAVKALTESGAVALSHHGQGGTILVERNVSLLWGAVSNKPVTGVMPLPGSIELSGLATAVSETFSGAGVPLSLAFRLGSTNRIEFLDENGTDFIGSSLGYARTLDSALYEHIDLGRSTYHTQDSAAVITRSGDVPGRSSRIGIDRQSFDHVTRSEAEFPEGNFIDCAYQQIPHLIVDGEIDAAVWHRTSSSTLRTAAGLQIHALKKPVPPEGDELSRAALITANHDRSTAFALLTLLLDRDKIQRIQGEVIDAIRVPAY